MSLSCQSCGYVEEHIKNEQIVRIDPKKRKLVYRCPQCGHLIHHAVHYHHEREGDVR